MGHKELGIQLFLFQFFSVYLCLLEFFSRSTTVLRLDLLKRIIWPWLMKKKDFQAYQAIDFISFKSFIHLEQLINFDKKLLSSIF